MSDHPANTNFLHEMPDDIQAILCSDAELTKLWDGLTPLARNEWICWVTIVKTEKTRQEHLIRLKEDLLKGKRRPCCWPGCPHRRESAKKWFKTA
ncbi:MAG: YdeI/OmpD-associated family protein [bacterium]